MAKKEASNLNDILKQIKAGAFAPVYLLMGEESYFIDLITNEILDKALTEDERDFNLSIFYGADSKCEDVINSARRFPMMAARQVTVIKEAQQMNDLELLSHYLENPQPSTVLVIVYRHKTYDSRKKLSKLAKEKGVVFDSKRLYDNQVPDFILKMVKDKGLQIESRAVMMMAENIGNDIARISTELDKLIISDSVKAKKEITVEDINEKIGISKEYNNFELTKAVAMRDVAKVNLILANFAKNTKSNPPIVTVTMLFNYFSNLMLCFYSPDKSERGIAEQLNMKSTFFTRDYIAGLRSYNAFKTMENITLIRTYDAKLKGVDSSADPIEVMRELLFKLMH